MKTEKDVNQEILKSLQEIQILLLLTLGAPHHEIRKHIGTGLEKITRMSKLLKNSKKISSKVDE